MNVTGKPKPNLKVSVAHTLPLMGSLSLHSILIAIIIFGPGQTELKRQLPRIGTIFIDRLNDSTKTSLIIPESVNEKKHLGWIEDSFIRPAFVTRPDTQKKLNTKPYRNKKSEEGLKKPLVETFDRMFFQKIIKTSFPDKKKAKTLDEKKPVKASNEKKTKTIPPKSIYNPPPQYPRVAKKYGMEGLVLLAIHISKNGICVEITVLKSSGYKILDDAAVNAIRKWRFTPATKNGIRIEGELEIPVRFKLID